MTKSRPFSILAEHRVWWFAGAALMLAACLTSRGDTQIEIRDTPRILTLGIDSRDYDEIVDALAADLLSRPELQKVRGKVLGLGPIDDSDCPFRFDAVTFQEQLATRLHRSQQVGFSEVINTMKAGSAAAARTAIKYFDYERETATDKDLLAVVGELAKVDFLLFGRLSCQIATAGERIEVTYRFNWKILDLKEGTWVWAQQISRTKANKLAGDDLPDWVSFPRGDNAIFLYFVGQAIGARNSEEASVGAADNARKGFCSKLGDIAIGVGSKLVPGGNLRKEGLRPAQKPVQADAKAEVKGGLKFGQILKPLRSDEFAPEAVTQARFERKKSGQISYWSLYRLPRKMTDALIAKREAAAAAWEAVEQAFGKARGQTDGAARIAGLRECAAGYAALAATYPLNGQGFVETEQVVLRQAEVEQECGLPCAARKTLASLRDRTLSAEWQAKAEGMLDRLVCDEKFQDIEGKTVAVVAAKKVGANAEVWRELQSALEGKLRSVGAALRGGLTVTPDQAVAWTLDGAKVPGIEGADMVWLVCAEGEVIKGEPDSDGGIYYFDGELRASLVTKDKVLTLLADKGRVGRTFPDERMCLGSLLANAVAKRCLEKYSEKPVQTNKP
jgi:hypothetical protein